MKPLTFEQAEHVRKHRRELANLPNAVHSLVLAFCGACKHKVSSADGCPVCEIYEMLKNADDALFDLWGIVDAHLERSEVKP